MALSPDGRTIAVGASFSHRGKTRIYDLKTGRVRTTLDVGSQHRLQVAYLPDGRLVSAGDTLLLWGTRLKDEVKPQDKPLAKEELDGLWMALADSDPAKAWPAMVKLADTRPITFIQDRLKTTKEKDELRASRAVEVLEAIGTPGAKGLLKELAKGELASTLAKEAKEAVARLERTTP
jgi:hypothetical protein